MKDETATLRTEPSDGGGVSRASGVDASADRPDGRPEASHAIWIEGEAVPFVQASGDTVLRAALRAGLRFPYECNSGGCGSCRFELIEGEVDALWPDAPGLTARDRRKGYRLACQCSARGRIRIRARLDGTERAIGVRPARHRARFVSAHDVTHDIREFRFMTDGPAAFLPGQYAMLSLPGIAASRAYSMSNTSNDRGEWHFQIRRVVQGAMTAHLFDRLAPGDHAEIDGPYGLAFLRPEVPRDIVCIAGGSGLAPMVSIARGAAELGMLDTRRLHFVYGGRTPADICGDAFLRELAGYGDRIRFYPVVSSTSDSARSWQGETGFVHDFVRRAFADSLVGLEFYFAGPTPMTQSLQQMLMVDHRVPFEQIHFDRFF